MIALPLSRQIQPAIARTLQANVAVLRSQILEDGTISGRFTQDAQVYQFSISPFNQLDAVGIEALGERSDTYLMGFTLDSGLALQGLKLNDASAVAQTWKFPIRLDRVASEKVEQIRADAGKGKPCGKSYIAAGLECRIGQPSAITPKSKSSVNLAALVVGAAIVGLPLLEYQAFVREYRKGFDRSAEQLNTMAAKFETEYAQAAAERTGKPVEELTPEEKLTVERYPSGSPKKRAFSVDPKKPAITFTVGGFNDYGEDGTGMAVTLKRALRDDSIIPLTNKKVQITPEDTWLPMNDLLDDTLDPDGKGGTVERGFLARRGATKLLKQVLGDRYEPTLKSIRGSGTYQAVEPAVRQAIRTTRDLSMLANNAVEHKEHADAKDIAAQILMYHRSYPDKPLRIVAHSGGGIAAAEAAEILNRKGIKVKVAAIGTPHFGLTDLPPTQLVTIASTGDFMMNLPVQNRHKITDVTAHNWVGHGGTQGYGSSKQMEAALKEFFYSSQPPKEKKRKPRRKDEVARFDGKGKPCGDGHIAANLECHIGQSQPANLRQGWSLRASHFFHDTTAAMVGAYQNTINTLGVRAAIPYEMRKAEQREMQEKQADIDRVSHEVLGKTVLNAFTQRNEALEPGTVSAKQQLDYVRKRLKDPTRSEEFKYDLYKLNRKGVKEPPTLAEQAAIRYYSDTVGYKEMNMTLRGQDKELHAWIQTQGWRKGDARSLRKVKADAQADTRMVVSGLNKMPAFQGKTYRGLTLPQDVIDGLDVGGEWQEKGFTSTTKNFTTRYPGNVMMVVNSKQGRDISEIEKYRNEEVLFKPNTRFKITAKRRVQRLGQDFWILVADEVDESSGKISRGKRKDTANK